MCCCLNGCVTHCQTSIVVKVAKSQHFTQTKTAVISLIFKIERKLFLLVFYFLYIAINFTVINPHCIFGCRYLLIVI